MREVIDKPEWVSKQYASDSNLNARIALHKRFSTSKVEWTAWVLDQVAGQVSAPGDQPLCVLEIGAGPGTLWSENRGRVPANWQVTLSDLSPGMALSAQRNLATAGVDAHVMVAGRRNCRSRRHHAMS